VIEHLGSTDITDLLEVVGKISWQERTLYPAADCPVLIPSYREKWADIKPAVDDCLVRIRDNVLGGGALSNITLAKVPPGKIIFPHRDKPRPSVRIHVPITTNPYTLMICPLNQPIDICNMKAGEVYQVDIMEAHMVVNAGDTDRVHLHFDYLRPENKLNDVQDNIT